MIENLNFGKTGFKTSGFEKHFISYSCILFIKYYAFRSFCIKLLCFSKNCVFQIFDQSNLFLDRSKMRLKFWFEPDLLDRYSINWKWFSIDRIYFSINQKSYREFLKPMFFTCSFTISKSFKLFSLSLWSVKASNNYFCCFPSIFFKGFCHLRPVRPLYPSFFIYFHYLCIFSCF